MPEITKGFLGEGTTVLRKKGWGRTFQMSVVVLREPGRKD